MDSEKKALPSMIHLPEPEPIIIQKSQVPVKTSSDKTKKYLITAVIVVLMLLITLGAVFAIVKITHKYTEEAIKEYHITVRDNEKETSETVKVDKQNGMTEVDAPDLDLTVFNDFKKGLTVLKTHIGDEYGCYMTPISQDELTPEAIESFLQHHPDGKIDIETPEDLTNVPKLMPADETVKDRNFLSQHVREACEGLPLYWLIPAPEEVVREGLGEEPDTKEDENTSKEEQSEKTQEQSETSENRMAKRDVRVRRACITSCRPVYLNGRLVSNSCPCIGGIPSYPGFYPGSGSYSSGAEGNKMVANKYPMMALSIVSLVLIPYVS